MRRLQVVYNSIATCLSFSLNLFYLTYFITNAQKDGGSPINQTKYLINKQNLGISLSYNCLAHIKCNPFKSFLF